MRSGTKNYDGSIKEEEEEEGENKIPLEDSSHYFLVLN